MDTCKRCDMLLEVALAERAGHDAHVQQVSFEKNPHDPDSDVAAGWSHGWLTSAVYDECGKRGALLDWIGDSLDSVIELLASGTSSPDELAGKLQSIIDKVR